MPDPWGSKWQWPTAKFDWDYAPHTFPRIRIAHFGTVNQGYGPDWSDVSDGERFTALVATIPKTVEYMRAGGFTEESLETLFMDALRQPRLIDAVDVVQMASETALRVDLKPTSVPPDPDTLERRKWRVHATFGTKPEVQRIAQYSEIATRSLKPGDRGWCNGGFFRYDPLGMKNAVVLEEAHPGDYILYRNI